MADKSEGVAGSLDCPLCESKVDEESSIATDLRILTRLRLNIPVKCAMASNGCGWEGELSQLWEHFSSCSYFPRPCPFNCDPNVYMPRDILKSHLQDKCPLKSVSCEYKWAGCDANLTRKEMAVHMKDCVLLHNELLAKAAKNYRSQVSLLQAEIDQLKGAKTIEQPQPVQEIYSPSKKRKVTFSQSADIINGGRVPDPVQPQHDNMSLVTSVTTPTNHSPSVNRQSLNKQRSGGDIFLSSIIGYANDMNKKVKQCPPLVCRYIKSDWRTLMIMCQSCETWYHSMCVHLVNNKVRDMTEFICPSCKKINNNN